jgi:poly(3-hydroxybutyrate) depolymerase
MTCRSLPAPLLLAIVWLPVLAGPAEKTKEKIASELTGLADWCLRKKLPVEAAGHLKEALALVPGHPEAKKLSAKTPPPGEAGEAVREQYGKEAARVLRRIGPLFLALSKDEGAGDAKARDAWLLRGRELVPEDAEGPFTAAWKSAVAGKDWPRAARLLGAVAEEERTPGMTAALRMAELAASTSEPVLRTAKSHPMKYWLSLPKAWTPDAEWPILVTADGAGQNWKGSCLAFMRERERANSPFIVVSVCRLNAKDYPEDLVAKEMRPASIDEWFDLKGVTAVAGEVAEEFHGRPKWFQTGFSAGGAVTWYLTIFHPERLAASAPACGGFGLRSSPGEEPVSRAPERAALSIRCFIGVDDKLALGPLAGNEEGLREHWKAYAASFAAHGFGNVEMVLLPGVAHSPCAKQVMDFFKSVLEEGE